MNSAMAVRSITVGHSSRQWMLRSFIAGIGGTVINCHRRLYTSPSSAPPQEAVGPGLGLQHGLHSSEHTADRSAEPERKSHLPWYLQNQPAVPEHNEASVSARQRLPNLPTHPPELLQPLLEHVSVSLGMDDLALLDLRSVEPPPALGANLLMIVGTARSEKHLHVSADRLCRWLRSEHQLSPYADGLLGRQELKVKMRRLAKKKKMMSHVRSSFMENDALGPPDDGIRTGWVCVNVGRIEGGELPKSEEQLEREADIVGFGTGIRGSSVVVQLMTAERRGEIELERLWTTIIKKSSRERDAILGNNERLSLPEAAVEEPPSSRSQEIQDETIPAAQLQDAEDKSPEKVPHTPSEVASFTPFAVRNIEHKKRRHSTG